MPSNLVQSVRDLVAKPKATFTEVFNVFHQPKPVDESLREKVVLPKQVSASAAQRKALEQLPNLLDELLVPTTRRKLTAPERVQYVELLNALREVEGLTKDVRESVRTSVLNHGDLLLEEAKLVDATTPREKDGHYIVKRAGDFQFPEQDTKIVRQATEPKASVTVEALQSGVKAEDDPTFDPTVNITKKELLSLTKPGRYTTDAIVLDFVRKNPERAEAIKALATLSGGSLALKEEKNEG